MKTNLISKNEFLDLAYNNTLDFYERINKPEVFIIKNFYDPEKIKNLRQQAFQWGMETEASWHPCFDGIPDYHRIHDNYEKAYVKSKMHAYYYHGFFKHNAALFSYFSSSLFSRPGTPHLRWPRSPPRLGRGRGLT